jgi:hypothetical protein
MADEANLKGVFTTPEAVRLALHRLFAAKAHPHFAGYLCVCRTARESVGGGTSPLKPDFKSFFDDFLTVKGAPERRPYILPFPQTRSPFFNRNVAGSYAPSSLRDVAPFRRAVTVQGSRGDATYSLLSDHASKARSYMLGGTPLPVASLAIFLYRDYELVLDTLRCEEIVGVFRNEFGFRKEIASENNAFLELFLDDSTQFNEGELFVV